MQATQEERARIYEEYSGKVLRYLRSKITSRETAEDLCEDVFVKVFQKLDEFDESKASLSTWIYTIARNRLTDYFRTRRVSEEIPETLAAGDTVESEVLHKEQLSELAAALRQLSEKERDIIILRYNSGMTIKDAALRLGISYSYAKLVHNTALVKMRKLLEKE